MVYVDGFILLGQPHRFVVGVQFDDSKILRKTFQQRNGFSAAVDDPRRTVVNDVGLRADVVDENDAFAGHKSQLPVKIVSFLDNSARVRAVAQVDDQVGIFAVFLFRMDVLPHDDGDFFAGDFYVFATFGRRQVARFVPRTNRFFTDVTFDFFVLNQSRYADGLVRTLYRQTDQHRYVFAVGCDVAERFFAEIQKRNFV